MRVIHPTVRLFVYILEREKMEKEEPTTCDPRTGAEPFLSFAECQERMVEAIIMLWRMPDREKGWQRMTASDGPWGQVVAEWGDYADADAQPRLPGLRTAEVDQMEEALGWMAHVPARDRKLVGLAIVQLAKGAREISWRRLLAPMGMTLGTDGLRMRYGRALNGICAAENGGNAG